MCQVALELLHCHLLLQLETETLLSDLAVISLALYNNFFYTQLVFAFFLQKDFDAFRKPLFEAFLCFSDRVDIFLNEEKIVKYLIIFYTY